jgi:hypothetical protein
MVLGWLAIGPMPEFRHQPRVPGLMLIRSIGLAAPLADMPTIGIKEGRSSETPQIKHHDDARRRTRRIPRMIQVSSPSLG